MLSKTRNVVLFAVLLTLVLQYALVYPNPLNSNKYVVVGRGYLTEYITSTSAESNIQRWGKNLERLPWDQPDYMVWTDTPRSGMPYTVQKPDGSRFRHTPATYLEAGYFGQNWQLDTTAPVTTLSSQVLTNGISVTLTAGDNLGGFGITKTEYKLDGGAWTTYSAPFVVTTMGLQVPATPAAVTVLVSPINGTTLDTQTPTFTWSASTGATSYDIQVLNAAPPGGTVVNSGSSATTSYTASAPLPKGATYYWQVRACTPHTLNYRSTDAASRDTSPQGVVPANVESANTAGGCSAWSSYKSFTVSIGSAGLSSPTDGSTTATTAPTLSWGAVTGADFYRVQVFQGTTLVRNAKPVTNSWPVTPDLAAGTTYTWKIRSCSNTSGCGDWTAPWSFTTP
jgi:hypothetical protein